MDITKSLAPQISALFDVKLREMGLKYPTSLNFAGRE